MDNFNFQQSGFGSNHNNSLGESFFSQFFQNQNKKPTNPFQDDSKKYEQAFRDMVSNLPSSVFDRTFTEAKIRGLCVLTAFCAVANKTRCDEKSYHNEMLKVVRSRNNCLEKAILDTFEMLSHVSHEEIFPFLDKINDIYPGLMNDSYKDKEAKQDSDNFFEEVVLASASSPEWSSIYKRDAKVEEWINKTSDQILEIISNNISKTPYKLSNLPLDKVCKYLCSLYIALNENFLPLTKYFTSEKNSHAEGMRSICGVVINGICHIRDGIFCNICREFLKDRNPEERIELLKYFKDFAEINIKTYYFPKAIECGYLNGYVQQILHYRNNVCMSLYNAKKFLELESLLPKLENYEKTLLDSEYLKRFPTLPPFSRESLTPVGEIILFLDSSFRPLKTIHFNGRQHYTQFIFENDDSLSNAIIMTGNVKTNSFDKKVLRSVYDVYLDINEKIHASYDDRFATLSTSEWYQKLNEIMIRIDSSFRKIIYSEWQRNPSLFMNLPKTNTLIYFLLSDEIFSATDNTFPDESLENRDRIEVAFPDDTMPKLFKEFFPDGCTYSQTKEIVRLENDRENLESLSDIDPITSSEKNALERIKKYLPPSGRITWKWLEEYLTVLGPVIYDQSRGKGSHGILKVSGYGGFSTVSRNFKNLLGDTGCDSCYLKNILKSIMGEKYSLEFFADALEKKFKK